jgi:hypothetical protein
MMMKEFDPMTEEVNEGLRIPSQLAALLARPVSNIRIKRSRKWQVGHVACMGKNRNPNGLLVQNPERNSLEGLRVDYIG